jgi:hypothetical protein
MTEGPGKYDDVATIVRVTTMSKAVIVVVFEGIFGSGFSVQSEGSDMTKEMPYILRQMAEQIEKDFENISELKPEKGKKPNVPNG